MVKRNFQISEQQVLELRQAFEQTRHSPTRTRYQAVRLYGVGYSGGAIQEIAGSFWLFRFRIRGTNRQGKLMETFTAQQRDQGVGKWRRKAQPKER